MIDFGMVMALLTAFLLNIISKYHVKQDEEARVFCGGNGPAPNVMMMVLSSGPDDVMKMVLVMPTGPNDGPY